MLLKCDIGCAVKALLTLSVISKCENVLEIQETNSKAIFRRGQALLGMNDFYAALKDLQKVRELQPEDKGVLNEIARAKKAKLEMVKKEKQLYSKMFK